MKATLVIENIKNLLTIRGKNRPRKGTQQGEAGLIENGIVAVNDDKIIYIGKGALPDGIEIDETTIVVNAEGKTVTPGLIDPHTHLVHGGSREHELPMKLAGKGYLEILAGGGGIHSTARATEKASFEDLYKKAEKSLNTMMSYGVTTVEAKSGYGIGSFETELKQIEVANKLNRDHPLDIISTFMGAHAVPEEYKGNSDLFVDKLIKEQIPYIAEKNLAKFCDVFCEEGVFSVDQSRRILNAAKINGLIPKVHADEIVSLGGAELAAEIGCISAEHLIGASNQGIEDMAEKGTIAVLLPGTSFNLQKGTLARARKMIEKNVAVAISTDYNPGSCPSENLQLMMTLASLTLKMQPEEVIVGVTINAAAALGIEDKVGSLEVGKKADIAIFDAPNLDYMIYHFGINHTDTVIKNGKIVYTRQGR
ncbi:imidazolonepropionase [Tissierella creatinini]|nr:imidazolonepropionase [Tissierella creatinini]TJX66515.1 imidazolonepropionase [Soehngenia saccharolytica]